MAHLVFNMCNSISTNSETGWGPGNELQAFDLDPTMTGRPNPPMSPTISLKS